MFPLYDISKRKRIPFVTVAFIALCGLAFAIQLAQPDLTSFLYKYALVPQNINFTDISTLYPFVTAIFLHGGLMHIASNMWFLWVFGDNVEEEFKLWYLPFILLGGVVGNLIQYFTMHEASIPILGASGAVAAVLGAYIAMFPFNRIKTLLILFIFISFIDVPAWLMLGWWFVSQLFNGVASITQSASTSDVAWFAHLGGFAFGYLVARLLRKRNEYYISYRPK